MNSTCCFTCIVRDTKLLLSSRSTEDAFSKCWGFFLCFPVELLKARSLILLRIQNEDFFWIRYVREVYKNYLFFKIKEVLEVEVLFTAP